MTKQQAPAVVRLEALVDGVAPRDPDGWDGRPVLRSGRQCSRSRAKQLRATVAQLRRAVEAGGLPDGADTDVAVLLGPEATDVFLERAVLGEFRTPDRKASGGLSQSSYAALRDCLKILGELAGVEDVMWLPAVWRERLDLPKPVPRRQQQVLFRKLADLAFSAPLDARLARSLSVLGVILDSGMQTGGLVSRRVDDLDLEGGTVRGVWRRQNAAHLGEVEKTVPLRPGTVAALRRWLVHRDELVAGLEGSDHGMLWVTVHEHPRLVDGVWQPYPAGMPLRADGLRRAHGDAMDVLNDAIAASWEGRGRWRRVSRCPERLRRGVDVSGLVPELSERLVPVRRPRLPAPPRSFDELRHGLESTYVHHKCRCPDCSEAMRRARRARLDRYAQPSR